MQLPPHIERAMTVLLNYGSVEDGSDTNKSVPDNHRTESLDRQISALRDLSLVWNERLTSQISDISRKRNSLQPIARLPNELLLTILSYATRASSPTEENWDDYYTEVEKISRVERLWKDLLESCQEVWTVIALRQSPAQIRRALSKSGSRGLHVYCTAPKGRSFRTFLGLVIPHIARWKSLVISGTAEHLVLLDGVEAPSLETLRIEFEEDDRLIVPSLIFRNGVDRLHSVDIERVVVPQGATWLKSLRALRIGKPANTQFQLPSLLGVLRNNTTLVKLNLNRLSLGGTRSDGDVVHLPYLEVLKLDGMDKATLTTIFASIVAPACRKLEIDLEGVYGLLGSSVLASWLRDMASAFSQLDAIALRLERGLKSIQIQGNGVELTLKAPFQPLDWARAVEKALKLVGLSWHEVKILEMAPRHLLRYAEYIHASALNVTTFQTTAYLSLEYDALYSVLAGPRFSRTGLRSWVFRRLDTIKIGSLSYSHGTDPILIELLKARYGEGARKWQWRGLPPPAQLKEITVPRTPELEAALKEIQRSASRYTR